MDMNPESPDNSPTEQFRREPGGRGRGRALRWTAGVGAAVVLIGGGIALAASDGAASPATADMAAAGPAGSGQAAALSAVLSAPGSAAAASLADAPSPSSAPAGTAHPCAAAARSLRAAGHPRLAHQVRRGCRGRLARLRLLVRGIHGEVTFATKAGDKTLAFERGTITAVTGSAITVQASDGTTWTWHLVSDTVIRQGGAKVSASSLADGEAVFAGGPVVSGADNARLIVIRPAAKAQAPSATPSAAA
jgi:hypothetical protein